MLAVSLSGLEVGQRRLNPRRVGAPIGDRLIYVKPLCHGTYVRRAAARLPAPQSCDTA